MAASMRIYLRAMRLPFLTGSLWPVALATALAYLTEHAWSFRLFLLTVIGVGSLHLGANLLNDYYDSFGSDPINRYVTPFSGGSRVIQDGLLSDATVKTMAYACLAIGVAAGALLIYAGRPWVAAVGLVGLLCGYLYSAAPVQLMSAGLGELAIFLAFGPPLSFGAYYVQTGSLKPAALALGLPLGFLITAILWINQFPDFEADEAADKRHLVVRLGLKKSRWIYTGLMLAPFASLFFLLEACRLPDLLLAGLATMPLAIKAIRGAWTIYPIDPDFIPVQALTIQTHFWMGLALTLSLLYAA